MVIKSVDLPVMHWQPASRCAGSCSPWVKEYFMVQMSCIDLSAIQNSGNGREHAYFQLVEEHHDHAPAWSAIRQLNVLIIIFKSNINA